VRISGPAVAGLPLALLLNAGASCADVARGRALYGNHCAVCHTSKVHSREPRLAADIAQLTAIVERWQAAENLRWARQDIDVAAGYLRVTYYNY
jgi:mono/diheme cytochrome c family protein